MCLRIEFDAEIPVVAEAGMLKDRLDMAWAEIKAGLVRAVSIGFRALKYAFKDDGSSYGVDDRSVILVQVKNGDWKLLAN